jgi:ribonucleoside-diphosphate reductase alpha chain
LGSLNLAQFAEGGQLKEERLREVTRVAVRMLDNVIDRYGFAVEKVQRTATGNRRVGLGLMGFADLLYQLKIGYDTPEGLAMAERVMSIIQKEAHAASRRLAEEKGVFPNWEMSVYAKQGIKMRNAALTTVAPTGTISMMYEASGGVEPFFALAYHYKGILGGSVSLHYVNKYLEAELKERGLYSDQLVERIIEEGSLQNIPEIPEDIKRVYVTAMDIKAEYHIRMQAAFQKHVDNSISKTCNFPFDATHDNVRAGYLLAWKLGCKGLTVYRDGSREVQVLNLNKKKDKVSEDNPAAAPASAEATKNVPMKQEVAIRPAVPVFAAPVSAPRPAMASASARQTAPAMAAAGSAVRERVAVQERATDGPRREKMTGQEAHEIARKKIEQGVCPECDTALQPAEGCTACPNCGWALCSL